MSRVLGILFASGLASVPLGGHVGAIAQDAPYASIVPPQGVMVNSNGDTTPYVDPKVVANFRDTVCQGLVFGGVEPTVPAYYSKGANVQNCNDEFSAYDDSIVRGPLWVVERLTAKNVAISEKSFQHVFFHDPQNLPPYIQAHLADYEWSRYLHGQMAPQRDMTTDQGQYQAGSLGNTSPMDPSLAYSVWPDIERIVRSFALRYGEVYVVTGPLFSGSFRTIGPDKVALPAFFFKAFYVPSTGASGVYIVSNDGTSHWMSTSLAVFTAKSGVSPFPRLPASYIRPFAIPDPTKYHPPALAPAP